MITRLRGWYYSVKYGIRNLWVYAPVIWRTREWDHAYLLELMEFKLRRMAVSIGGNGNAVNSNRKGRQLLVAAELCRRIRMDDYIFDLTGGRPLDVPREEFSRAAVMAERNLKYDLEYLCRLMNKHLLTWWD